MAVEWTPIKADFINDDSQKDAHSKHHNDLANGLNTAMDALDSGSVPAGGVVNDVLTVVDDKSTPKGLGWRAMNEVPAGGSKGQVLMKVQVGQNSDKTVANWQNQSTEKIGTGAVAGWMTAATGKPSKSDGKNGDVWLVVDSLAAAADPDEVMP